MSGLIDMRGNPISSDMFKKGKPPILGEAFTPAQLPGWPADRPLMMMPGGSAIQFDLSRLTLTDYRMMRDNYQINSSLSILTFLIHQLSWHIECSSKKNAQVIDDIIRPIWTVLVRALGQAFWAGFSPNILQWDNDTSGKRIIITKIKDLFPEDSFIHWKNVEGYAPPGTQVKPKIKVYDGIDVVGARYPIPVDNSFWYPLLMENNYYYGRKLLKPAFQPWFFSILLHLFANRYYERFGEPTPIGRAPYDDTINFNGSEMSGNTAMQMLLSQIRSRAVVVLPNNRTATGINDNHPDFDYQVEYLESQMRGADFERYMTRLDEEMSLALFTPILLMRTADVGSYNLGEGQTWVYLMMLNAIAGDIKKYIDDYIIARVNSANFGLGAPEARIVFSPMSNANRDLLRNVLVEMIKAGYAKVDLVALGEQIGLKLDEVSAVLAPPPKPGVPAPSSDTTPAPTPTPKPPAPKPPAKAKTTNSKLLDEVFENICARVDSQISNASRMGRFSDIDPSATFFGYYTQFERALTANSVDDAKNATTHFYNVLSTWLSDIVKLGWRYENNAQFMRMFRSVVLHEKDNLLEIAYEG